MIKKQIFLIFLFFFSFKIQSYSNEIKIIVKVGNEIITNIDLENQKKYLLALNENLNNLSNVELLTLSKNSIINQVIKEKEIKKNLKIDDTSNLGEKLILENYIAKGFSEKSNFLNYLNRINLDYEVYKNKLITEKLWSTLVYEKFRNKIKVDEENIRKKTKLYLESREKLYKVSISELILKSAEGFNDTKNYIIKNGFENAAIKFSLSDTASKGGYVGWVDQNNLAPKISEEIKKLKVGDFTNPIKIPNGVIILKLNSKKEVREKLDFNDQVKKRIDYEKNRQLKSFSMNYYNKLKQNTIINEY